MAATARWKYLDRIRKTPGPYTPGLDTSDDALAVLDQYKVLVIGAGGLGWDEATKRVDYEGALKIFDALELVRDPKPRLIMVSAIDVRDRNVRPPHYVSTHNSESKNN